MMNLRKDLGYETYNQMHGAIWNSLVENERILHIDSSKKLKLYLSSLLIRPDISIPDDIWLTNM